MCISPRHHLYATFTGGADRTRLGSRNRLGEGLGCKLCPSRSLRLGTSRVFLSANIQLDRSQKSLNNFFFSDKNRNLYQLSPESRLHILSFYLVLFWCSQVNIEPENRGIPTFALTIWHLNIRRISTNTKGIQ